MTTAGTAIDRSQTNYTSWSWRPRVVAAGVLLTASGATHPPPTPDASFDEHMASMLADSAWIASHTFAFVGAVALLVGLVIAYRNPRFRRQAGRVGVWAIGGSALWTIESVFHLLAERDLNA